MVLSKKKILILSLYYHPDIGPGAFRIKSIIESLRKNKIDEINLITTYPFRYPDYKISYENLRLLDKLSSKNYDKYTYDNLNIYRIKLKAHDNTMFSQINSYIKFFFYSLIISKKINPDLVFATSGRLMTAFTAYLISIYQKSKLIVEYRDIFSYGIKNHNFFKLRILNKFFSKIFLKIENIIIKKSIKVNFVSEEFKNYYNVKFNEKFKFYPNGIDEDFLNYNFKNNNSSRNNILYVGNIGEAQNLHIFLPAFANLLPIDSKIKINVFGSGGGKKSLLNAIINKNITNIKVQNPIPKIQLLNIYKKSDILLINLADKDVFTSVIPSKIYEYIITKKPILIGCKGEVEKFKKYSPNLFFFNPSDPQSAIDALRKINNFEQKPFNYKDFKQKFSRENISNLISKDIYNSLNY